MAQPLPRPCPYCKTQYQKTPAVHVGKCLALQQLLAIRDSPQEQTDHGRSSYADSSTLGEPKPTGPSASKKSAEEGKWQRREQNYEESSTTKADNSTTARRGVGGRASTGSTKRCREYRAENVSTPRTRNTDVGGGSQLCVAPVHTRIINPPAVVSHKSGMEAETRGRLLRFSLEDRSHDVRPPGTSGKVAEERHGSASHSESASRMANLRPEMAVRGMASSRPQADADNPHSNYASGHHEDGAGAHPGGVKAELRASLPLHPATQRELPNRVSDHAPHGVHEARGSQATQPLHGDGGSVGHAAHRRADHAGAQQTRKACRGAPQTSAKTLIHYFQRGAVTGPRAAEAGPVPDGRADQQDGIKAAQSGQSQYSLTADSERKTATFIQGSLGTAGAGEVPSTRGATDDGKRYDSAEGPDEKHQLTASTITRLRRQVSQSQVNVLQTRMLNRRNQCYANALITCLHSVCHEANCQIGSIQEVILELARLAEADIFTRQEWTQLFRGWRRPTQQHDVTELLHHFAPHLQGPAMQGEWAVHRPNPSQPLRLLDSSPTQPYVSMHIEAHHRMQDIVSSSSQMSSGASPAHTAHFTCEV